MTDSPTPKYRTVMVIDDSDIDRYIAKTTMERTAFAETVISMESAREALEFLNESGRNVEDLPHYIFLDINMPDMNGFDFLEEYRKLPETIRKNCIIMMLTTSLNQVDRQRAEANEFVHRFLNKPLDKDKLALIG